MNLEYLFVLVYKIPLYPLISNYFLLVHIFTNVFWLLILLSVGWLLCTTALYCSHSNLKTPNSQKLDLFFFLIQKRGSNRNVNFKINNSINP